MALTSRTRLGPYEILALIGKGGMGEVYKAKDTRLDRTVAIKVLPEHLAESPERKARFEREAKAISKLNHPHICTLYDVGEQDGIDYLVMEYIEGETLAERLKKGAMPLDKVLEYGIQIADGLDTAHRAGIVHRDLKPGNAMLTKSGIKLLDFGLAKVLEDEAEPGASDAPTRQKDLTKEHAIIGTLQYMAPEQLEGRTANSRADIWAFGAVLYEMATGEKAFEGASQASLISAIMKDEPRALSAFAPIAPRLLEHTVRGCLDKDPDERWQSVRDVARQLEWIADSSTEETATPTEKSVGSWRRAAALSLVVGAAAALLAALAVLGLQPEAAPDRVQRLSLRFPPSQRVASVIGRRLYDLSPDGRHLVYIANRQLHLRPMDTHESQPIRGTEGASNPFFSPDGEWIGFWAQGSIQKVSVRGGVPAKVCDVAVDPSGVSWSAEGTIVFALSSQGIYQVPAAGGAPEPLVRFEAGEVGKEPTILPGGQAVMFTSVNAAGHQTLIQSLEKNERRVVIANAGYARYAASGHLVYPVDTTLMAVGFDLSRMEVVGSPTPVMEIKGGFPMSRFAFSDDGTLVYEPRRPRDRLVWVDRSGGVEPLPLAEGRYGRAAVSPDARFVCGSTKGAAPISGSMMSAGKR